MVVMFSSKTTKLAIIGALASGCGSADASDVEARGARTGAAAENAGRVTSGTLRHWGEASTHLNVEFGADGAPTVALGAARGEGLDAFWSVATTDKATGGAGFFYGDAFRARKEARVARASAIASIAELGDASTLAYSTASAGPVPVGGIVVFEHAPTRRYLALVLESIEPTDPRTAGAGPYAYADVRWYLSAEGSADFSSAR